PRGRVIACARPMIRRLLSMMRRLLPMLLLWPTLAWGQTPEAPARLQPIVVTPERLEQQAGEAPASVTVISADDLLHSPNVALDISRRPTERSAILDASYGSYDTKNFDVLLRDALGPFRVSLEGNYFDTAGYKIVLPSQRGPIDVPADSRHSVFNGRLEFVP